MHSILTLLIAALAFLFTVTDVLAQRAKSKPKSKPRAAVSTQSKRHTLWRVQSDSTVVYIMGSVHMLPKGYHPLDSILERSLDSSDVLVLEMKLDPASQMATAQKLMSAAMLEEGLTLDSVLDRKTYAQARTRLKSLGLDIAMFERFEPWMVALTLAGLEMKSSGFSGELGVDAYFSDRAQREGKEMAGLETAEDQLALFDSMPLEAQTTFLRQTLDNRKETQAMLQKLAAAWRAGDIRTLEKLALSEMQKDTAFYRRMLVERNANWLPKIEAYLNDSGRRTLVVVGAAHLLGRDGVIEMLRAKGYDPQQL